MNDDWRLRIGLREGAEADALSERLESSELEHDLETSFGDRVILSIDGPEVFCYAGAREQAERAEALVRSLAAEHGWHLSFDLQHWHPLAEEWEEPDKPLPESDAERAAERAVLIEQERAESRKLGFPEYEVRVQCSSHRDTVALAEKLRPEGLQMVRRWKFLLLGALDEDSASALAERVRRDAPAGTTVTAETNMRTVLAEQPGNPFAVFGGLAG